MKTLKEGKILILYDFYYSKRAKKISLKIELDEDNKEFFVKIVLPIQKISKANFFSETISNKLNINTNSKKTSLIKNIKTNIFNKLKINNSDNKLNTKLKNLEKRGLNFLIKNKDWAINNIKNKRSKLEKNGSIISNSREEFLKNKEAAKILCEQKVKYWADIMGGLEYNRITVKNLKTRWGSCSSKKNLNFNYKIIFLKESDQDYLIVHELSHLIHMNHSKDFWSLVCKTLDNNLYYKYKIKV